MVSCWTIDPEQVINKLSKNIYPMSTKISVIGGSRPAPRWWRNFERGMIMIIIPSTILVLQGWEFTNPLVTTRAILIVNVILSAVIKFIGMMLVDPNDNYISNLSESDQAKIEEINTPPVNTTDHQPPKDD